MILRDYQEPVCAELLNTLQVYNVAYLAGQMRTGKTITALETAGRYGAKRVMFFTRKNAIADVNNAYAASSLSFEQFSVLNYEKLVFYQDKDKKTGRPTAFRLKEFFADYLMPDLVILDEAHGLGQYPIPAMKIRQLKQICEGLPIIYLSGTPSPESYSQLYHQFYVSSFSPFHNFKNFYLWAKGPLLSKDDPSGTRIPFVRIKKQYLYNREINNYDNADKELIDAFTKHLFVTMTQEDAGFNHQVMDQLHSVAMQPSTYFLAEKLYKDKIIKANDGSIILASTAAQMMGSLHQIYSGTIICEEKEEADGKKTSIVKTFDNSKARFIKLHHEDGLFKGKLAILYLYRAEYTAILMTFGYDRITDDVEEFRNTNKVFVKQITSASEGVNLSCADHLVMYNISHSAKAYLQARERMNTKDRQQAAICHWMFADKGIEWDIYEAVKNKLDYTAEYFKKHNPLKQKEHDSEMVDSKGRLHKNTYQ